MYCNINNAYLTIQFNSELKTLNNYNFNGRITRFIIS